MGEPPGEEGEVRTSGEEGDRSGKLWPSTSSGLGLLGPRPHLNHLDGLDLLGALEALEAVVPVDVAVSAVWYEEHDEELDASSRME